MSLARYEVRTSIAVSDMGPAVDFYERKLGLAAERVQADDSRIYSCGAVPRCTCTPRPPMPGKRARPSPPGTSTISSASSTS